MKHVHVLPLLSPTQHHLLPKTPHAHGRAAMNAPVLRCLFKNNGAADGTGFYVSLRDIVLSAVSASIVHLHSTVFHLS